MRLRALQHIYGKGGNIPDAWVVVAEGWTEEQKREFVIKDNAAFGEWDWDALANEWNDDDLADWGIDVPQFSQPEDNGMEEREVRPFDQSVALLIYHPDRHEEVMAAIAPLLDFVELKTQMI